MIPIERLSWNHSGTCLIGEVYKKGNIEYRFKVNLPAYDEKGWYITIGTYNTFRNAQGKLLADKLYVQRIHPDKWVYIRDESDFLFMTNILNEHGISTPEPEVVYNNFWHMYKEINWDYKRKKFYE